MNVFNGPSTGLLLQVADDANSGSVARLRYRAAAPVRLATPPMLALAQRVLLLMKRENVLAWGLRLCARVDRSRNSGRFRANFREFCRPMALTMAPIPRKLYAS